MSCVRCVLICIFLFSFTVPVVRAGFDDSSILDKSTGLAGSVNLGISDPMSGYRDYGLSPFGGASI